jgi:LAO/AO transport system kinase
MTDTLVREINSVLALGSPVDGWRTRVIRTQAASDIGVDELIEAIDAHRAHIEERGTLAERRRRNLRNEVMELATIALRRELEAELAEDVGAQELIEQVVERRLDPGSAAREILARREDS